MNGTPLDAVIIGAGPAGLAIAIDLLHAGCRVTVFDKGPLAGHITRFPHYMRFFSTPELLEIGGLPLVTTAEKPSREEYLIYLRKVVQYFNIPIRTYENATRVTGDISAGFTIHTQPKSGDQQIYHAKRVVIANGAYSQPRRLNVPGEDLAKVSHYFTEVHPYFQQNVLIVGGRNSAAETALLLCRNGVRVSLSYRKPDFIDLKYWLKPDIKNRIAEGAITAYFNTEVVAIRPDAVDLRHRSDGKIETIANDYVLALTGYEPELTLLQSMGIEIQPETQAPVHNPDTFETNVPGIYIGGVIVAGNVSGNIFIENGRYHGRKIVPHLLQSLKHT